MDKDRGSLIKRQGKTVAFLDRALRLVLLSSIVIVPLAFPRFMLFFPVGETPFSDLLPSDIVNSVYTPLNLKEGLATYLAVICLALWVLRSLIAGRMEWVWTPLHTPIVILLLLAAASLAWPFAWRLRFRDFSLVLCYTGLLHLLLLYGRDRLFRRKFLDLFFLSSSVFLIIVFAMEQGWHFGPFRTEVQDNRRTLFATIGHNISVASYLMLLVIYGVGRIIESRKKKKKLLYAIMVLVALDMIVAAQTVGVWFALAGLTGLVVFGSSVFLLKRNAAVRFVRWQYVVIGAGFVLLIFAGLFALNQMVEKPGSSPIERLKMRIDPEILATGTRARLWTISLNLIQEKFPFGIGFAGFKYIYPDEQGRWFRENPETVLQPTPLHSDRVHNDYLQVWLELGLPGLLATLWAIFLIPKMQWRVFQSDELGHKQRIRATIAFLALFGTLLHLLTSFEMHVATTALFFLMGMMLWIGEGKLGVWHESPLPVLLQKRGMVVLTSIVVVGAALFFHFLATRHIQADYHFNIGELVRRKQGKAEDAVWFFTRARMLAPYRGQIAYHEGFMRYRMAEAIVLDYQNARAGGQAEKAKALLDRARKQLNVADRVLSQALETYHFKDIYFYRAKARSSLGLLTGNTRALESAVRDFKRTIEIYPPDLPAYYELGKLYYTMRRMNEALNVWKAAQKYDYYYMNRFHVEDALYLEQSGMHETAMEYFRVAMMLDKDNPWYYQKLFNLAKKTGNLKEAIQLGKVYLDLFPNNYGTIIELAKVHNKLGNQEAVKEWLNWFLGVEPPTVESVISAVACLKMLDRETEAINLIQEWYERNKESVYFVQEKYKLLENLDVLLSQQGRDEERIELWEDVIDLPEDHLSELYRSISRYYLARVYVQQGQHSQAWNALEQAYETPVEPELNTHVQGNTIDLFWMSELPLLF